jgi:hypothetical protein
VNEVIQQHHEIANVEHYNNNVKATARPCNIFVDPVLKLPI